MKTERERIVDSIMKDISLTYTPESEVYKLVKKGCSSLSMEEVRGLSIMIYTSLPTLGKKENPLFLVEVLTQKNKVRRKFLVKAESAEEASATLEAKASIEEDAGEPIFNKGDYTSVEPIELENDIMEV